MFQHMDEFNFTIGLAGILARAPVLFDAFLRNISEVGGTDGLVLGSSIALVFALFAVYFSWELAPRLDEGLMIPVIAYVVAISCMGILAAFRYTRTFPQFLDGSGWRCAVHRVGQPARNKSLLGPLSGGRPQ
ncbi:MAG: hypothetical protein IPP33_06275 [Flavobacteriales bacterium]|nr:hypothetical protein [Flavobacteriales bacterium]